GFIVVFFFSSRRRHTRSYGDWSSDVCSSDLSTEDQRDVRELLATITSGQREDLTRWGRGLAALANAEELRNYTYLVAGCVGEFWTRVCFRKVQSFTARDEVDMLELGRNYG